MYHLEELDDEKKHTDIPAYSMYNNNGGLQRHGNGYDYGGSQ